MLISFAFMGRGFGRGAKSVAIVTHSQVGNKGKKVPKGLRGVRQKKRQKYQRSNDPQAELEQSLGLDQRGSPKNAPRTMAQEIASIQFPHIVNKRQKGFKQLRKQIVHAVKDVRRRHAEKSKRRAMRERASEAVKSKMAAKRAQRDE